MNLNIKVTDCKFYVNEKNRTVTCVIEDTKHLLEKFVNYNLWVTPKVADKAKCLYLPNKFVGIARCAPEDTWDEDFGRRLAYTKAREKLHTVFFKRANDYVNEVDNNLNEIISSLNMYGIKVGDFIDARKKELAERYPEAINIEDNDSTDEE